MRKKTRYYRQCKMKTKDNRFHVAWIPEEYATVGRKLAINERGWWTIVEVWGRRTEDDALAHERDFLNQRKQSDV